jgi:hypothetical protein
MNIAMVPGLQYPIGNFSKKDHYSKEEILQMIAEIETAPAKYQSLVADLSEADLLKTYREGSWNIRQLVHHVADIQMLHFLRMKKALTESDYIEVTLINMDGWALTTDGKEAPVEDSLPMLEGITKRYVFLLKNLSEEALQISYYHPLREYDITQVQAMAMSAWHLKHHLAHIKLPLNQ